jgi:hypothetical protein
MGLPLVVGGIAGVGLLVWKFWPASKGKLQGPPHKGPIPDTIPDTPNVPTVADNVFNNGKAKANALALYSYLKTHGTTNTPELNAMIKGFQQLHNADPEAYKLTGPIPVNGLYDVRTSAALTLYSHDPIPADPLSPLPPIPTNQAEINNIMKPGSAATSAYNVYMYIKAHGKDNSSTMKQLVRQFQYDWNTDPKVGGPANKMPLKTPPQFNFTIPVTGNYDAPTQKAMGLFTKGLV